MWSQLKWSDKEYEGYSHFPGAFDDYCLGELRDGKNNHDVQCAFAAVEPMDLTGGNVEADTRANRYGLSAEGRLA